MFYLLSALDCSLCICSTYSLPWTVLSVYVLHTFCLGLFSLYMFYTLSALDCSLCICSTHFLPWTILCVYVLHTFCLGLFSVYMFYTLSALDCSLCICSTHFLPSFSVSCFRPSYLPSGPRLVENPGSTAQRNITRRHSKAKQNKNKFRNNYTVLSGRGRKELLFHL